ncbi:MAG: glycosyltransferase [Nitrospinae bacterium]|nr:glycosyltransferase [Nitrospinota bacterium]
MDIPQAGPRRLRVTAIIPALNEEEAIGPVVEGLMQAGLSDVVVVDNGSDDETAGRARQAGARVVGEPRRGYGAACWAGLQAAQEADVVLFLDGDGSDDPAEVYRLLEPLHNGTADLVLGARIAHGSEPGALTPQARLGNWVVTRLIRALYGLQLTDIPSLRAIARKDLERLSMAERTYGWPVEMVVKAAKHGYRIQEVPIRYRRRRGGTSKVAGTVRGTILAAWYMLTTTLRHAWRN